MKHRVTTESQSEENAQSGGRTAHSGEKVLVFETVESALRQDAAAIDLPAGLRERVMNELAPVPSGRSWWQRWIRRAP